MRQIRHCPAQRKKKDWLNNARVWGAWPIPWRRKGEGKKRKREGKNCASFSTEVGHFAKERGPPSINVVSSAAAFAGGKERGNGCWRSALIKKGAPDLADDGKQRFQNRGSCKMGCLSHQHRQSNGLTWEKGKEKKKKYPSVCLPVSRNYTPEEKKRNESVQVLQ